MGRGERGSMLLLVLFVLTALASIAGVAVQKVNEELQYAGNVRKGTSAFHVTVSGSFTALGHAAELGASGFVDDVETQKDPVTGVRTWTKDTMVSQTAYFDLSKSGSFGYEGEVTTEDAEPGDEPYDVTVEVLATGMKQPLVGYSLNGPGARCRFKYRFDANGRVGNKFTVGDPDEDVVEQQDVWQQVRSYLNVGPLPCDSTGPGTGAI
jgi:hypothetical protein